jgi:uncharacterized protein involved in exopolysaccharide biosynthesis
MRESQLRRRVDIAQALYETLARELERARSEEIRDTPAITVITSPHRPLKKSAPHRLLLSVTAALAAFLLYVTRPHLEAALRATIELLRQ